jgi:GNAT superfamily N-acetyltransferase
LQNSKNLPISPKASPVPMRVMRSDDIPAGLRLCRASGWNQVAADWERFLAVSPDGCRVALDKSGNVIGSVATLRFDESFGWIAMVLVDPAHRRAGVGTSLLEAALHLLDDMPSVGLDATRAGFRIYEPAGFHEDARLQRMQRWPAPVLPSGGGSVRAIEDGDFDELLEWDKEVFGADRRWLLESFRGQAPSYALVAGERNSSCALPVARDFSRAIAGYMFGRPGHDFDHIGPVIARDEDIARSLVSACLAAHPGRPFIIDAPARQSWMAWLESQTFVIQRPFARMYRGQRRHPGRTNETFAVAGPEFA